MTITDGAQLSFRPKWPDSEHDLAPSSPRQGPVVRVSIPKAEQPPRWLPYVVDRLGELQQLSYELDDEVPAPHPESLQRALPELRRFMHHDTPTPSVVPTFDGGIQFVWHKGGWDVEVEVGPDETFLWARRREGGESWYGSLGDQLERIRAVLSELEHS